MVSVRVVVRLVSAYEQYYSKSKYVVQASLEGALYCAAVTESRGGSKIHSWTCT